MESAQGTDTKTFLRHNAVFFVGSLSVGALNYLYYPVLGRLMHPGSFGEVQALSSLLAQVSIFLNVFGLVMINIVANYANIPQRNKLLLELEKLALLFSLIILALSVTGQSVLQHFFRFGTGLPFTILALAIVATVPLTLRSAFLRGKKQFGQAAAVGAVASAADLLLAALFVLAGWGTAGAILGLVGGQAVAFGLAVIFARRAGFTESLHASLKRLPDLRLLMPELRYAGVVLIASLAVTILYSIDTIAVKHYFDASTAGLYAGISTIARIIFFLTASIAQVLLPSVKLAHPTSQNRRVLFKSLAMLICIGGLALCCFALAPKFVIGTLMGTAYIQYANLLPRLSFVLFIISLINLFVMYHLALRRYWIVYVVVAGMFVLFLSIYLSHGSLQAIISSLFYASLAMFGGLGVWASMTISRKLRLKEVQL